MQLTMMEMLSEYMNHITLSNTASHVGKTDEYPHRNLSMCMDVIAGKTLEHARARLQSYQYEDGMETDA